MPQPSSTSCSTWTEPHGRQNPVRTSNNNHLKFMKSKLTPISRNYVVFFIWNDPIRRQQDVRILRIPIGTLFLWTRFCQNLQLKPKRTAGSESSTTCSSLCSSREAEPGASHLDRLENDPTRFQKPQDHIPPRHLGSPDGRGSSCT